VLRLPWSRIYRAFPELDQFSDDECERYLRQVYVQRRTRGWPVVAAVAGGVAWPLLALSVARLSARSCSGQSVFFPVLLLVGEVLAVALPLLWMRDFLMIRSIRGRIDNTRCTACRHSLLGLPLLGPPEGGRPGSGAEAVRCPECGSVMVLSDLGLVTADLIPREHRTETAGVVL